MAAATAETHKHKHFTTWTEDDVTAWSISSSLPTCASHVLAGYDGIRLSQVTRDSLMAAHRQLQTDINNPGLASDAVEVVYCAVSRLREHYVNMDMIAALQLQAQETPDLSFALETMKDDIGCMAFDQSYSSLVHECELEKQRRVAADAEHASRLSREAQFDGVNARLAQQEEQKRLDHELARRIEVQNDREVRNIVSEHGRDVVVEPMPDEPGLLDSSIENTSDSVTHFPRDDPCGSRDSDSICDACMETTPEVVCLDCEHKYCIPCLQNLFCTALKDSSMVPVACCRKTVPQDLLRKVLSKEDEKTLISRMQEKLSKNKMYCANLACSKFIDLDLLTLGGSCLPSNDGVFDCVDCGLPLCVHCKSSADDHHGANGCRRGKRTAAVQAGEVELISLAAAEGWKRCPGCATFVSLKSGCNHITCACGYEFCFACGIQWASPKPCTCVLYTEEMLLRENHRRVQRREERLGREFVPAERAHIWQDLDYQNQGGEECSHANKDATLFFLEFVRGKDSEAV
eukprot:jgi/Tetstr1/430318/TSEL_020143.t1